MSDLVLFGRQRWRQSI